MKQFRLNGECICPSSLAGFFNPFRNHFDSILEPFRLHVGSNWLDFGIFDLPKTWRDPQGRPRDFDLVATVALAGETYYGEFKLEWRLPPLLARPTTDFKGFHGYFPWAVWCAHMVVWRKLAK